MAGDGSFPIENGKPFGPENPAWRYVSEPKSKFYSSFLSGVQRLGNGHTLICSGMQRNILEVDSSGRTVWTYIVPTDGDPSGMDAAPMPGPGMAGPPGGPGGGGPPRPLLITILDINADGFIDAAEIAQASTSLKKLDRDGDGVLSLEECLPAPGGRPGGPGPGGPPPGGPASGPPRGPGGGPGRPPLPPIFTVLDSNGDGKIDGTEIEQASANLLKLDTNGDGRISLEECLPVRGGPTPPGGPGGPGGPPPLPPIITIFGTDRLGIIPAASIARAPELLLKLDLNGDGKLTPDEYLPGVGGVGNPAPPMPPIVTALDVNGDGIIDSAEIAGASAALAKLDKNGDGNIAFEEALPSSPDGSEAARHGGLYRAERYALDYPAFKGRTLTPLPDAAPAPKPPR